MSSMLVLFDVRTDSMRLDRGGSADWFDASAADALVAVSSSMPSVSLSFFEGGCWGEGVGGGKVMMEEGT